MRRNKLETLTTGLGGGLECRGNLWVHLDREAFLNHQLFVSLLNLGLDPVGEGLLEDGVDDVADPLLGHLHDLPTVRQVIVHRRVLARKLGDVLESEALVRGDGDVSDAGPVDALLAPADQVLEEVDRHLVCMGNKRVSCSQS